MAETPTERSLPPRRDPHEHPEPSQLERFMHLKLPPAEVRIVIRHLMTGCQECRKITGKLFNLGGNRMLDLKAALAETPPPAPLGRRGKPGDRRAAVSMMVSAAQELLLEMARELERFSDRLRAALTALTPAKHADAETADVLVELRNVIGCVLTDCLLCRARHKMFYAASRIMPSGIDAPSSNA